MKKSLLAFVCSIPLSLTGCGIGYLTPSLEEKAEQIEVEIGAKIQSPKTEMSAYIAEKNEEVNYFLFESDDEKSEIIQVEQKSKSVLYIREMNRLEALIIFDGEDKKRQAHYLRNHPHLEPFFMSGEEDFDYYLERLGIKEQEKFISE